MEEPCTKSTVPFLPVGLPTYLFQRKRSTSLPFLVQCSWPTTSFSDGSADIDETLPDCILCCVRLPLTQLRLGSRKLAKATQPSPARGEGGSQRLVISRMSKPRLRSIM